MSGSDEGVHSNGSAVGAAHAVSGGAVGAGALSSSVFVRRETFSGESFDVKEWVSEVRRYVPLETLKRELEQQVRSLKQELIEYINKDYDDFLLLSSKLFDVDGSVLRMREPLVSLRDKVDSVARVIEGEKLELEEGMRMRKELMASRQVMELLMDAAQVAGKVEKLIVEMRQSEDSITGGDCGAGADGVATGAEDARTLGVSIGFGRLLERIAGETARLKYLCRQGRDIRLVASLAPRCTAAERSLIKALNRCFGAAIRGEGGREEVIMHCLRGYAALLVAPDAAETAGAGDGDEYTQSGRDALAGSLPETSDDAGFDEEASAEASGVIRRELLDAHVKSIVEAKLKSAEAGSEGAADQDNVLAAVYVAALEGAYSRCAVLLRLANNELSSSSPHVIGGTILSDSILASIDDTVANEVPPSYFSPGNPDRFVLGYRGALELIMAVESRCCSSENILTAFRGSRRYAKLLSRFNTQAYFTLRQRGLVTGLSGVMDGCGLTNGGTGRTGGEAAGGGEAATAAAALAPASDGLYKLETTAAVAEGLDRCWSEEVFLAPLADRFLMLSLQMVTRYYNWLKSIVGVDPESLSGGLDGGGKPTSAADAGDRESKQGLDRVDIDDLARICHDVTRLCRHIDSTFLERVLGLIAPFLEDEPRDVADKSASAAADQSASKRPGDDSSAPAPTLSQAVSSSFEQVTSALRQFPPVIVRELIASAISERCTEVLRQLRGITATYRMTNKPAPTRPSPYTASILRPLVDFSKGPGFALLADSEGYAEMVKIAVVERVSQRFHLMAEELIETVKKTESSLKKLKNRGSAAGSSEAGSMSDTDKICLQLLLDVQEYARQAKDKLDIDVVKDTDAYAKLLRVVEAKGNADAK